MESFSVIPIRPIAVLIIRMTGPTKAKELFKIRAFSILLNLRIVIATEISIRPEIILSKDIPIIALSNIWNNVLASFQELLILTYANDCPI